MAKIAIDAGHGGSDPGAVFEGRQEKDDNLRLALAVGEILQQNGVDVFFTRTEDIYQTPFQKATLANESGADFLVSLHRNSSPVPNQYTGVESLVYNKAGEKLEMAENINSQLEEIGFRNIGVKERPGLVILRRSKMPAVLVEAGFINSEEDNRMFDEDFDRIAQGIAQGILDTIQSSGAAGMPEENVYYRVQTGAFRNPENAQRQLEKLVSEGYPAFIIEKDGYYLVQVGAFLNLGNATRMEGTLRSNGYQTYITT
ncbi:N-acetylmuramoyl-L-alanine amidase [Marvinbryantia formatexigens DSM 14469]|uniref:N-acetylmuramoyl-L-alanine amidase n=1 Tax=Marvinbryantia formatexigens DSM 14469 TaxID=478749 RepID=C6LA86_9FIRM|nr:N-acetylmuramoyl-L-alanine amidase [Marvinbryantia formatexigens]EET62493.1 N-acetylmuramoyl-L-alanine amidase [Marvinbryantia formatexigens DSM 14469]UWO24980.1 N-acetylmuramoyl-L-alanine amidase [Marvinbryantia formatexigens DSM 14469]SDG26147.1 N-acetylmuramoyl-L-alanine amidase [Marvinbryantia formatexigens]